MINESTQFKRFEILAERCDLSIYDWTHPETVVGRDYLTGETVRAGCFGKVRRIYIHPSRNSIMVLISVNSP